MSKITLGKEFKKQLADKNRRYSETAGEPVARKRTLKSNIDWADDVEVRADSEMKHQRSEYHRQKASRNEIAVTDEEPREHYHHGRKARNYRIGAYAALFIEVIISALMFFGLLNFAWVFEAKVIVAVLMSAVVTLGLAYVLHGPVSYLIDSDDPSISLRWLRYIIIPSLVLIVLSIIAYIAIQRLDPITLLAWQPVLSSAKFVAMIGLLGVGVSMLVGGDIYDWSAEPAADYQELQSVRQEIANYKREWADELNGTTQSPSNNATVNNTTSVIVNTVPEIRADPAISINGNNSPLPKSSAISSFIMIAVAAAALMSSACSAPEAHYELTPVVENIEADVIIDATGVKNHSVLQKAGQNFFYNVPGIVHQHNIKRFSILWFGNNGWTPELRATVDLPVKMSAKELRRDMGDLKVYREDVLEAENKLYEDQLKAVNEKLDEKYLTEIRSKFSEVDFNAMIPPKEMETSCSDLNGLIGYYAQPDSTKLHLIFVITDARQNCHEDYTFQKLPIPQNKKIIFIIVPGTEGDGLIDYELRQSNILAGCPSCTVVPYHRKDLSAVTLEAVESSGITRK